MNWRDAKSKEKFFRFYHSHEWSVQVTFLMHTYVCVVLEFCDDGDRGCRGPSVSTGRIDRDGFNQTLLTNRGSGYCVIKCRRY